MANSANKVVSLPTRSEAAANKDLADLKFCQAVDERAYVQNFGLQGYAVVQPGDA